MCVRTYTRKPCPSTPPPLLPPPSPLTPLYFCLIKMRMGSQQACGQARKTLSNKPTAVQRSLSVTTSNAVARTSDPSKLCTSRAEGWPVLNLLCAPTCGHVSMLQALLETFESVLRSFKEATNRHQADHQLVVALSRNVGARGPSEGPGALSSL